MIPFILLSLLICCGGTPIDITGCTVTKGCFLVPEGCDGPSCDAILTWQTSSSATMIFEIEAAGSGQVYVTVNFTPDTDAFMSNGSVVMCNAGANTVENRINRNGNNRPVGEINGVDLTTYGISSTAIEDANGKITCRFERMIEPDVAYEGLIFPLTSNYFVAVAEGSYVNSPSYHGQNKWRSGNSISLTSFAPPAPPSNTDKGLQKAHGICMMVAWLQTAGIGIFYARFRKAAIRPELWGKAIWFRTHQIVMTLVLVLVTAGFVCILVTTNGIVAIEGVILTRDMHVVAGTVVVALTFLQPLLALIRCHPDSERRWIFNWIHRTVGQTAFFASMFCLILATQFIANFGMSQVWCDVLLGLFVGWIVSYFIVEIGCRIVDSKVHSKLQDVGEGQDKLDGSLMALNKKKVYLIYFYQAMTAILGTASTIIIAACL